MFKNKKSLQNVSAVILALVLSTVYSTSALSDGHAPAEITGTGIHLFERDHSFAGKIKDFPVLGVFNHQPYGSHLTLRKGEKNLELVFNLDQNLQQYTAELKDDSTSTVTRIFFKDVSVVGATSALIKLEIDGVAVDVNLNAQSFEGNHFKNSVFTASIGQEKIEFLFTGESCPGYSSNIAMMILGAYAHLLK